MKKAILSIVLFWGFSLCGAETSGDAENGADLILRAKVKKKFKFRGNFGVKFGVEKVEKGALQEGAIQIYFDPWEERRIDLEELKGGDMFTLECVESDEVSETDFIEILAAGAEARKTNWKVIRIAPFIADEDRVYDSLQEALANRERVYILHLNREGLDRWPARVGKLTRLKELSLAKNKIARLPQRIGELTHLEHLDVSKNAIGEVPRELWNLANLEFLSLAGNEISGLPQGMAKLKKLRVLHLNKNSFAVLPPEIAELDSLRELDLHGNKLSSLPPGIKNLKKLRKLSLGNPFFGGNEFRTLPLEITEIESLEELVLSRNSIAALPPEMKKLRNLKKLWVNQDFDTKEVRKVKSLIPNLHVLKFSK